jgi:hypothetical protein
VPAAWASVSPMWSFIQKNRKVVNRKLPRISMNRESQAHAKSGCWRGLTQNVCRNVRSPLAGSRRRSRLSGSTSA